MSGDASPDRLFDVFGDEHVRAILRTTSGEPKSVKEISRECGVARSTIYRRVDTLVEQGLLTERTQVTADRRHYTAYEAALERLTFELADGEFDVDVSVADDASTRFTSVWEDIRDS